MSGSKTRLGFSGGDEPPPSDSEGEASPRAARTMIGHDIHLRAPLNLRPAGSAPLTPRQGTPARVPETPRQEALGGVPEAITDDTTEELPARPSHSGKTKFPALARLFGRWTTGGRFLSRSRMSGSDDDFSDVPREAWVSRAGVFLLAAVFSFLVALAVLKLHRCSTAASGPSVPTQVSATSAPYVPPAAGVAPEVLPTPSPAPGPSAAAPVAAISVASAAQFQGVGPTISHRPARRAGSDATGKPGSKPRPHDRVTSPTGKMARDALLPLNM